MVDPTLTAAAERVADRWTLLVVAALLEGPRRFSDLREQLDGIAPNTLSSRLSRLEDEGLVVASPYQQRPERFTYELTAPGRELRDVVLALRGWAARRDGEPIRHDPCGTEPELRWWCPQCRRAVAAPDDDVAYV